MNIKSKYHHGDLRSTLIKTAAKIISKQGTATMTLRSLSQKVGVSHTAPYRHFANKTILLCAVAEDGFKRLMRKYRRINQDVTTDTFTRLQEMAKAYVDFALKNPGYYRLMFGHELMEQQRTPALLKAAEAAYNELLISIDAWLEEYEYPTESRLSLVNLIWASFHGLTLLLIDGQIRVTNGVQGMPTLLTQSKTQPAVNTRLMIEYALETLAPLLEKPIRQN